MGSRATTGVSTKNTGLIPKRECRRTSLAERSGSSSGGRTSSISWMLNARRLQEQVGPLRRWCPAHEHGVQCRPGGRGCRHRSSGVIKHYTIGNARTIVETMKEEDGFEAWREIAKQCEPDLPLRKQAIMQELIAGQQTLQRHGGHPCDSPQVGQAARGGGHADRRGPLLAPHHERPDILPR